MAKVCSHPKIWGEQDHLILTEEVQPLLFVVFFSLKLECEKLASEKTEMQRHYVMVRSVFRSSSHIIMQCYIQCPSSKWLTLLHRFVFLDEVRSV